MKHRIADARMIANRYDITCSCGIRVETHTAAATVRWLIQHRPLVHPSRGRTPTVNVPVQNVLTGEIRTIVVSDQLAERINDSPEPPMMGNWVPVR